MTNEPKSQPMKKRALVFCEDAWHSAALVQEGLGALTEAPCQFDFITRGDEWLSARLKNFSVAVVAKANHVCATDQSRWLTVDTQPAFRNFVRAGGGLFLIHSGVCYRDLPEMRAVTGGAFLSHPDSCPMTVRPKLGHPLTSNTTSFIVEDEHYFMALDATDADVFLHVHSEHGSQPAGWIRTEGEGRVCVLTPGHNREVWLHPEYQTLLRNGLVWLLNDVR
jgi:type 1 glutamine amidotransferase